MPLLDDLGKKITKTGQNLVRGTKDFTDVARLNSLITEDQSQIANLHSQIGRLFYETYGINAQEPFKNLCTAIAVAEGRIAKYQEEITQIKGLKHCPLCGAEIPLVAVFCVNCGAQISDPSENAQPELARKFCVGCGNEIAGGAAFCASCGQKVE